VARCMGLPIDKLVLATNENNVLDEFFRTGNYRVRGAAETYETSSPSMDISKASNFERFVFDLLGRNSARVAQLFGPTLAQQGGFALTPQEFAALPGFGFVSGTSTHADRLLTIRDTWLRSGVLIDTHTADGLKVAAAHCAPHVPMIVLETALPAKFAHTIEEALAPLGSQRPVPQVPLALRGIENLPKRFVPMQPDVAAVKRFIEAHCT
jgi:threonine synthase